MSWIQHHERSERLASEAYAAQRESHAERALALYAEAAEAEEKALDDLDRSKRRTLGISVVSAVSLYNKAGDVLRAEATALRWLGVDAIPDFAKDQLRTILQSLWNELTRQQADTKFAPGQVLVSVFGKQVVSGGAPLDLILQKAKIVESLFYRTAEFLADMPHRRRGPPQKYVQETCRPWLFQAAPGSYQFAVAIEETYQPDMYKKERPQPSSIAAFFLEVLRTGVDDPRDAFAEMIPDPDYRSTFLKLTRNLAPTGDAISRLDIRSADESRRVSLDDAVRKSIGEVIRSLGKEQSTTTTRTELRGVLRAVHLDHDWLELTVDGNHVRVVDVGEQVDDVIGPLVNKRVTVHVEQVPNRTRFLDIEPDD